MNTPKQQGSLLAWACLLLSSKERRRQTSKSIQGMEGTTPKSMCVNPAKLKLKQRLVKKWLEEQLAGISPCLAASCSVGPAEVVRSDKKLLGHRGNDMAVRRFTSSHTGSLVSIKKPLLKKMLQMQQKQQPIFFLLC